MKTLIKLLLLTCLVVTAYAKELKVESSLVTGKLDNGFEYTIKKNAKPSQKAEIQLLIKAGSLEEDDDQKGVAHLVEHMAFKGSKNFPKNSLVSYLESLGVAFGSHLNANTDTTRTIYILNVPLSNDNLQKSFLVFQDWAGGLNFDPSELEIERGVVIEEARTRDNVGFRYYQKGKDTIFAGSKYKDRTPIGDLDIIKTIKLDRVKDFYTKWYRPDLMHLVVVGDIDVKEVEALIKKHFKNLKNSSKEKTVSRSVPIQDKTRVLFIDDDEIVGDEVSLYFFTEIKKVTTEEDYKKVILENMALKMYNYENMSQLTKENPLLNKVVAYKSRLADNQKMIAFDAKYDSENKKEVLEALIASIYLIDKYGFKQESFDAIKKNLESENELAYKTKGDKDSASYAQAIVSSVEHDDIYVDEEYEYKLLSKVLKSISLEDVQKTYSEIVNTNAQLVLFATQTKTKLTKDEIIQSLQNAKLNLKKPKPAKQLPKTALTKELKEQKILSQTHNKEFDYWDLVLGNGVRVLFKFNDYKKEIVDLYAFSEGGYSLVEEKLLTNAKYATHIISESGTKEFTKEDIQKISAAMSISLSAYISRYSEGFEGGSSTKDFEELLSWIYLSSTEYTVDEIILNNMKNIISNRIEQEKNTPKIEFYKEFEQFYMKNNPRHKSESVEDIKSINKENILSIYGDRFADANNFTYIIVGDIEYEKVKTLASKYLANLPTKDRVESYKYRNNRSIKAPSEFIRFYEKQNISTLTLMYEKDEPYTLEEAIKISALKDLLSVKLREYIREEKSGVYGVRVNAGISRVPYEKATISISFTCDPLRRLELLAFTKEAIESLKNELVSKEYTKSIVKKEQLNFEQNIKTAGFWSFHLKRYVMYGEDIANVKEYLGLYEKITPSLMQKAAQKYLLDENLIYNELNPKELEN